jgi:uncharacterized membrane protein YphA (DoxX/SURF4 family)
MSGTSTTCPSPATPSADPARLRAWLTHLCRFVLAAVFLMAGITKITDPHGFEDPFLLRTPLPEWLSLVIVRWLPWLELTCGACLVSGYAVREASLIVLLLLVLFIAYSVIVPADADCSCFLFFFPDRSTVPFSGLLRNAILILCGFQVIRRKHPASVKNEEKLGFPR